MRTTYPSAQPIRPNASASPLVLPRVRVEGWLVRMVIVIAVLNLNGFFVMLAGVGQVFSPLLLLCCIVYLALRRVFIIDTAWVLFLMVTIAYLVFGLFFGAIFIDPATSFHLVPTMVGTILLVTVIVQHILSLDRPEEMTAFMKFVRNVALVAAFGTLCSPILYGIYANPPPSSSYRAAGLFANPNQAGLAGLLALALCMAYPLQNRMMHWAAVVLAVMGILLPFSKTAILMLLVLAFFALLNARAIFRLIFLPPVVLLFLFMVLNPELLIEFVRTQTLFELHYRQEIRLTAAIMALTGQLDSEVTTSRTDLVLLSIEKAMEVFPLGTGMNTFHQIYGGILGYENWLGSHNTFLMIWGEAGLLPLLIMLTLVIILGYRALRRGANPLVQYFLLIFLAVCMTSHSTLEVRVTNVMLALMIAVSAGHMTLKRQTS